MIMDSWQKHIYNDCAAFVGEDFDGNEKIGATISFGQREAYVVMKALEFQEMYGNPMLIVDPDTGIVSKVT